MRKKMAGPNHWACQGPCLHLLHRGEDEGPPPFKLGRLEPEPSLPPQRSCSSSPARARCTELPRRRDNGCQAPLSMPTAHGHTMAVVPDRLAIPALAASTSPASASFLDFSLAMNIFKAVVAMNITVAFSSVASTQCCVLHIGL